MHVMRLLPPLALLVPAPVAAVEIDGRLGADEWAGATRITDFRKVQPLDRTPVSLPTDAWILATPEGLAIAFRNVQPASVPRTHQHVRRDFDEQVDRVNVVIDFDADARVGYHFKVASTGGVGDSVVTNQYSFNDDWDGNWRAAVGADGDAWIVEMLIPWSIAPMRSGEAGERTLHVYLDRVIGSTGERSAWPAVSMEQPRFLSEFAPLQVPAYSQALLAITPYASGLYDHVRRNGRVDGGADLFCKPNGQFQLSATINPDFGQVESDDLVVNFSATETFVSDKRPFFTENQGLFEFTMPFDYSQLLYTRRIGAPADDGSGAGDIAAAIKLNGNFGQAKYGVFAADEDGEAGRSFRALRLVRDFSKQNLGMMLTQVERPYLDREADVLGIDHDWRPAPRWSVRTRLIGSHIEQDGQDSDDTGATVWADYTMDHGWRQQWIAMHMGNELDINDAGYLARNSSNYLHWEVRKRFDRLDEDSIYASKEWRWRVTTDHNDHGERLSDQFRVVRESRLRNGSYQYLQLRLRSQGVDDMLTRGHGSLRLPAAGFAYFEFERPRKGHWAHDVEAELDSGTLAGYDKLGYSLDYTATYFISDAFSVYGGVYASLMPDWLVWQHDNLIGSFRGREWHLNAGMDWSIGERQELRVKLQSLAIDAHERVAYRVAINGAAVPTEEDVDDFSVRNLGLQIRYRYELAPLSYLYVVYGRGGYVERPRSDGIGDLLVDSFGLRDDEQLLVKLSYRFEL